MVQIRNNPIGVEQWPALMIGQCHRPATAGDLWLAIAVRNFNQGAHQTHVMRNVDKDRDIHESNIG